MDRKNEFNRLRQREKKCVCVWTGEERIVKAARGSQHLGRSPQRGHCPLMMMAILTAEQPRCRVIWGQGRYQFCPFTLTSGVTTSRRRKKVGQGNRIFVQGGGLGGGPDWAVLSAGRARTMKKSFQPSRHAWDFFFFYGWGHPRLVLPLWSRITSQSCCQSGDDSKFSHDDPTTSNVHQHLICEHSCSR